MYIKKIWIENIRGFRDGDERVDLDLQRPDGSYAGWTVIAGRNGTGKSTLLKAIALAASGPSAARSLVESFTGWLRDGAERGEMWVELETGEGDRFTKGGKYSSEPFWAGLPFIRAERGPEPSIEPMESQYGQNAPRGPWADNPQGWFIAGYGPFRRLSGHTADAARLMSGPGRLARLASLFREDASLVECILWLREIYLRRLEQKEGAKELEESVIALLNDGLLPDGMRITHINSDGLWTERCGVSLPLQDLSDGYRTVTALVLDLIKQIHACFQGFAVAEEDGHVVVPYAGVVLIDEMDIHLHISWQQRIGFWLKKHFPNIQFIVTTHSPFICQAADPKGLIRLAAPGEERAAEHVPEHLFHTIVNGSADDAAVTALFGLEHPHSDQSEALRNRIALLEARLIRGLATAEEKAELKRLAAELPKTGSALVEQTQRKREVEP